MLRINEQQISEYSLLYDIIIPKDNFLRLVKENIDFSFANELLKESYSKNMGRPAKEPEMMFKLLFLKRLYDLSDVDLIERVKVDMSIKFFLCLTPEAEVVDASLLTKFRKQRINKEEILEEMLSEIVKQAIEKGLIKGTAIILDATHTKSKGIKETPTQILRRVSKKLRKEIYIKRPELAEKFPDKPSEKSTLDEELNYTKKLIDSIEGKIEKEDDEKLQKRYNKVKELMENEEIKKIQSIADKDAKTGYKSEDNSFFGYKNHIAMTDERIITAVEITSGEAADGKYYQSLVEKTKKTGMEVDEVLGDTAYSGKDNLDYSKENKIALISKLNPSISAVVEKINTDFEYIKDANAMRCKAGHLSIKTAKIKEIINKDKYENAKLAYHFDVKKCKECPFSKGCYTPNAKQKTHFVTLLSDVHKEQLKFQETEYFKERAKQRYMIEAKNSELKQAHGLDSCDYYGLFGMTLQSYFSVFVVNIKRIVKLTNNLLQSKPKVCHNSNKI